MTRRITGMTLAALFAASLCAAASAAEPVSPAGKPQAQEPIYGSQLMTREERMEHRNKMRSLKTPEERDAYRAEHHRLMQERAKEKGVTLPDVPPPRGMGMGGGSGPGPGMGRGMGPGGPAQ